MSETFLIKKTAYDSIRGDIVDRNANSFIIGPGELNGPAGAARNSDLELYGFGSLKWGEGVDQNLYRILENFACARKETGDYHPDFTGSPGGYDDTIHPVTPKDENDLGTGNGITTPIVGQTWYDTTSGTMFVYKEFENPTPTPTPSDFYWVTQGAESGTIMIDAKKTISVNDLECNGQSVSTEKYPALFANIGYTYGGIGTSFNVPNLPDLVPGSPTVDIIYIIRT